PPIAAQKRTSSYVRIVPLTDIRRLTVSAKSSMSLPSCHQNSSAAYLGEVHLSNVRDINGDCAWTVCVCRRGSSNPTATHQRASLRRNNYLRRAGIGSRGHSSSNRRPRNRDL